VRCVRRLRKLALSIHSSIKLSAPECNVLIIHDAELQPVRGQTRTRLITVEAVRNGKNAQSKIVRTVWLQLPLFPIGPTITFRKNKTCNLIHAFVRLISSNINYTFVILLLSFLLLVRRTLVTLLQSLYLTVVLSYILITARLAASAKAVYQGWPRLNGKNSLRYLLISPYNFYGVKKFEIWPRFSTSR